jgi:ATP-dependent protease ClpP protease subunit
MSEHRAFSPQVDLAAGDPGPLLQDGEIVISGLIEAGGRNSAAALRAALAELPDDDTVHVRLNSAGGHFDQGLGCYLAFLSMRKRIIVTIDGEASSAASLIAAAGDEVLIGSSSSIMVHEVTENKLSGGVLAIRQAAEGLERCNAMAADIYARKTGQDHSVLALWMMRERVFTGQQAVDAGFADHVLPDLHPQACPCCGQAQP